jgi:hypothetical protein
METRKPLPVLVICGACLGCSTTGIEGHPDAWPEDAGRDSVEPDMDAPEPDGDPVCPEHDLDRERGDCFEWGWVGLGPFWDFPMLVDLGAIPVGETVMGGTGYYNFCADLDSLIVGTFAVDTGGFENSPDFTFSSDPGACERLSEIYGGIYWGVTPTEPGFHRSAMWFEVEHGYYDFDLVVEAYEPGGAPVPLESDCMEIAEVVEFEVGPDREYVYEPLGFTATCSLSFGAEHLLIMSADIVGDDAGVFERIEWPENGRGYSPLSSGVGVLVHQIRFTPPAPTPPAPGIYEAEVVLLTNEPARERRVRLVGTAVD